jgi:ABC-type uncharacterized transport system substrate-binding protein
MKNAWRAALILLTSISCAATAQAQSSRTYRVGVLHAGGAYYHAVEGLRAGLKELGLQEGKQYTLDIRETHGDAKAAEAEAKSLEQAKVDVIFSVPASVSLAANRSKPDCLARKTDHASVA